MTFGVRSRLTVLCVAASLVASAILLSGCPDRITGEQTTNQKPVVYFVNIPPDDYQTSRNPIVYWIGTDPDGQVRQFRYTVVLEADMGGKTPAQYIAQDLMALPQAAWTYLQVDDSLPDPQTQNAVRMQADLDDPINSYVPQYVFLQAFDEQGLGSDVVYRRFNRNNNPPQTVIPGLPGYDELTSPFINAVNEGGAITGVRLAWRGVDEIDYPADPPPFEFQWKLLGPYTYGSPSSEYETVMANFVRKVFSANDGRVYQLGNHDSIIFYCDSLDTAATPDTLVTYECNKLLIDTITSSNPYGTLDSVLAIDDPAFATAGHRRIADSSDAGTTDWVTDVADTIYNVYRNRPSATTSESKFILWVRCRDDANVPDLVPAFRSVNVIEPKYEREVLVIDFTRKFRALNRPYLDTRLTNDTAFHYWKDAINTWKPGSFDTTDYFQIDGPNQVALKRLLQYKIVILYNDTPEKMYMLSGRSLAPPAVTVFKAIDAGVNVWQFARSAGAAGQDRKSLPSNPNFPDPPPAEYQRYFGITGFVYHGWMHYALDTVEVYPSIRIEDFNGAYSLMLEDDPENFPDLAIDTANLHRRYNWNNIQLLTADRPRVRWVDTVACLPEVGWVSRSNDTEPLYLYKSKYGLSHPLGPNMSYDGSPVAIRLSTSLYRTAHFSFTPLGMEDEKMQTVINHMLDWLYPANLGVAPNETINRYPNSAVTFTADQIRKFEDQRMEEYRRMNGIFDENSAW